MLRTTETGKKSCRASSVFIFSSSNSLTFKKRTRPSKTFFFLYKNQPFPSPPWQILEWSSVHSLQRSKKQPWWGWRGQRQMLDSLHQNHLDSSTHWVSHIVENGLSINWWSKPDEGQDGNANSLLIISCIKFILSNIPASLRKIYIYTFSGMIPSLDVISQFLEGGSQLLHVLADRVKVHQRWLDVCGPLLVVQRIVQDHLRVFESLQKSPP